jgi:hypothetical protein
LPAVTCWLLCDAYRRNILAFSSSVCLSLIASPLNTWEES